MLTPTGKSGGFFSKNGNDVGNTPMYQQARVGKLENFMSLSAAARSRAQAVAQRKNRQSSQSMESHDRRRSSVLGSLDKFLSEDCEATECTASLTHQSSFSSGLSSLEAATYATTSKSRCHSYTNTKNDNNQCIHSRRNASQTTRPARRGSVTKYSLETATVSSLSSTDDEEFFDAHQIGEEDCMLQGSFPTSRSALPYPLSNTSKRVPPTNEKEEQQNETCISFLHPSRQMKPKSRHSHVTNKSKRFEDAGCHIKTIDQLPLPTSADRTLRDPIRSPEAVPDLSRGASQKNDVRKLSDNTVVDYLSKSDMQDIKQTIGGDQSGSQKYQYEASGKGTEWRDSHTSSRRNFQRRGSVTRYLLDGGFPSCGNESTDVTAECFENDDQPSLRSERLRSSLPTAHQPQPSHITSSQNHIRHRRPLRELLTKVSSESHIENTIAIQDDESSLISQRSDGWNADRQRNCRRRGSEVASSLAQTYPEDATPTTKESRSSELDGVKKMSSKMGSRDRKQNVRHSTQNETSQLRGDAQSQKDKGTNGRTRRRVRRGV